MGPTALLRAVGARYRDHVRWAATALALALTACAGTSLEIERASVTRPRVPGGAAVVVAPEGPGPHPVALYVHGLRMKESQLLVERREFVQGLVDQGFIVAAAYAEGPAWGSRASQAAYLSLYEAVARTHLVDRVVVVSESMGGVAGLGLVSSGRIPDLAAWVGVSPVTNLGWAAASPVLAESVAAALTPEDVERLDPMAMEGGLDVPLVVYATPDDPVVDTTENAQRFAEHFGAELRECAGGHVAPDCFRPADVLALLGDAGL